MENRDEGKSVRELCIGFGGDCLNPDWSDAGFVHDWRKYISEEMRIQWHKFSDDQKRMIAESAEEAAGMEEWD